MPEIVVVALLNRFGLARSDCSGTSISRGSTSKTPLHRPFGCGRLGSIHHPIKIDFLDYLRYLHQSPLVQGVGV